MTKHEHNKKGGQHHGDDKKKKGGDHGHVKKPHDHSHDHEQEAKPEQNGNNKDLTKKDLKMIEKLKAKIEFHVIRDEYSEADKLREQIQAIQDKPARHDN